MTFWAIYIYIPQEVVLLPGGYKGSAMVWDIYTTSGAFDLRASWATIIVYVCCTILCICSDVGT